jgi:hypothetical protein
MSLADLHVASSTLIGVGYGVIARELAARTMRYVARAKLKIKHILCPRPHSLSTPAQRRQSHTETYPKHTITTSIHLQSSRQCRRHSLSSKLLVQPAHGLHQPDSSRNFNLYDDTNTTTACSTLCAISSQLIGNRLACAANPPLSVLPAQRSKIDETQRAPHSSPALPLSTPNIQSTKRCYPSRPHFRPVTPLDTIPSRNTLVPTLHLSHLHHYKDHF